MKKFIEKLSLISFFVLFSFPASTNYELKSYEFGAGGGAGESTNYSIEGIVGETGSSNQSSTNYSVLGGLNFVQMANVPPAPTFTNSSSFYNKLLLVINTGGNPTDTLFAVAITDDNWVTTKWVQNDNTVGATLGIEDYQTYANWGSGSGEYVIGLTPNKTYKVKVKAMQGNFTESELGPEATAATVNVSIDFDIDISSSDAETGSPYTLAFGSLNLGSVNTATSKVWLDLDTNAASGAYVYISDSNAGLKSTVNDYTISSVTGNLTSLSEGFGAQNSTDTESSGGPITAISPFNGSSENVGIINTTIRELYSTSGAPITGGRASFVLKAKPSNTTPASGDYSDTLTIVAAGTF